MGQVTRPPTVEGYIADLEQRLANLERAGGAISVAPSGSLETASSAAVAFTGGPELVIPRAGLWLVDACMVVAQLQVAGLTALQVLLGLNGVCLGSVIGEVVPSVQFTGGTIRGRLRGNFSVGDKLTLYVLTSEKKTATFQAADISATPVT